MPDYINIRITRPTNEILRRLALKHGSKDKAIRALYKENRKANHK